jgi:hypothetical protein
MERGLLLSTQRNNTLRAPPMVRSETFCASRPFLWQCHWAKAAICWSVAHGGCGPIAFGIWFRAQISIDAGVVDRTSISLPGVGATHPAAWLPKITRKGKAIGRSALIVGPAAVAARIAALQRTTSPRRQARKRSAIIGRARSLWAKNCVPRGDFLSVTCAKQRGILRWRVRLFSSSSTCHASGDKSKA